MPDIDRLQLPAPRKNWWQRLNEKPPGWDNPGASIGRVFAAVAMGLALLWVRSRH